MTNECMASSCSFAPSSKKGGIAASPSLLRLRYRLFLRFELDDRLAAIIALYGALLTGHQINIVLLFVGGEVLPNVAAARADMAVPMLL